MKISVVQLRPRTHLQRRQSLSPHAAYAKLCELAENKIQKADVRPTLLQTAVLFLVYQRIFQRLNYPALRDDVRQQVESVTSDLTSLMEAHIKYLRTVVAAKPDKKSGDTLTSRSHDFFRAIEILESRTNGTFGIPGLGESRYLPWTRGDIGSLRNAFNQRFSAGPTVAMTKLFHFFILCYSLREVESVKTNADHKKQVEHAQGAAIGKLADLSDGLLSESAAAAWIKAQIDALPK